MRKLTTLTLSLLLLSHFSSHAQFKLLGNTTQTGERCYRMTENKTGQFGSFWSNEQIDLDKSFEIIARMNFGSKNATGADGMAFAMGYTPNLIDANSGSDFAIKGLDPGIAVEFDTYQSPGYNDPSNDHIAIQRNALFQHSLTTTLAGPVSMTSSNANVEDGKDHSVRLNWNATLKEFKVYFDCELRLTYKADLKKDIYKGKNVYWGFSGACGSQSNEQTICIERASMLDDYNEKIVCLDETATLHSSLGSKIAWLPSAGLSNPSIYNPTTTAKVTTTYIASANHICNSFYKDTFKIIVPRLKPLAFPKDTALCEKQILQINVAAPDAKTYYWNTGINDSLQIISKSGFYKTVITEGNCFYTDSLNVTYNPLPKVALGKDTTICENKSIMLDATNTNATYLWNDASDLAQLTVNQADTYWVKVTTDKNCTASDTIILKVNTTFKTTQIAKICEGDFFTFAGKKWTKDTTVCELYNAKNTCDSTHCVTIAIKPKAYFTLDKSICKGDFFEFNKKKYLKAGTYKDILIAQNGCDSIVTINLSISPIDTVKKSELICENSSYNIGNQTIKNVGIYTIKLKDQQTGCDSIVILDLKIVPKRGFSGKKTICEGESFEFATQTLTKSGFYEEKLKNINGCDSIVDMTLTVIATPKVKIVSPKNAFCDGETLILTANSTATNNFIWSNGDNSKTITISQSGVYKVSIEGTQGCKGFDTILIQKSPNLDFTLKATPPSCTGYSNGKIEIENIIGGFGKYTTQLNKGNFDNNLMFKNLKEGNYKVTVKDTVGCVSELKIALVNPIVKSLQLADKQRIIKLGDSTLAEVVLSFTDVASIVWTPNERTEKISLLETWLKPVQNQSYKVMVKDSAGCVFSDSLQIVVNDIVEVFVPNIFSNNLDGTNDDLRVFAGFGVGKILQFTVFDRWGNQVFEAKDYSTDDILGWDGSFRGRELEEGVYTYLVKVLKKNAKEEVRKGTVLMLR
jgi:gliding motility-associated-like protein